jgi:hypothetical protein
MRKEPRAALTTLETPLPAQHIYQREDDATEDVEQDRVFVLAHLFVVCNRTALWTFHFHTAGNRS